MNARRDFLRTTALGALGVAVSPSSPLAAANPSKVAPPSPALANPRGRTLAGEHRNLFNGDSCVFFYNPEIYQPKDFTLVPDPADPKAKIVTGGPFKAEAIHAFVANLAKNGVDTFLVNANASRAWYPSKVIPTILDGYRRGDREFFRGHAICQGITDRPGEEKFIDRIMAFMNLYQDLLDAKVDWLAEAAKACRATGIVPWVSIRMNDFHGHLNIEGSFFNVPLLKQPGMRLKNSAYSPTMGNPSYRTALNFEKAEVRALMFAQIKEVVEDYDYAGLELDWWRQPLCCEPNASPETVTMISNWLREIRALTERRAKAIGRPYPFGLRIPGRLAALKSIGLDVATLCREGTIDFVSPSGFWCTTWDMPHDDLRKELGERVTLYGVIEDGANFLPARAQALDITQRIRYISSSREMLHANAAGKLVLGAEGIEWFNFYCTDQARIPDVISDYSSLRDINRLEFLRGKPKHYSFPTCSTSLVQVPFDLPASFPLVLGPGIHHPFRLPMCAEPTDQPLELMIQVVLRAEDSFAAMPVSFNGGWPVVEHVATTELLFPCGSLTHHTSANKGYNFRFPVGAVRDGWNEIVVENGGTTNVTLVCVELGIRPAHAQA